MEYLAWTWDAHWKSGSNYHIYHDLITNKWTWLPIDFGDTFGTSFEGKVESYRACTSTPTAASTSTTAAPKWARA